jgi:hypothetical protein
MTKAEYAAQAAAQDDWAPGWLAIDASFESVYPGVTPPHLGSPFPVRAIFGGEEYLDGISLFPSSNGYQHLLTYEVAGTGTVHGRVDLIQLVGITQAELDWVAGDGPDGAPERARDLVERVTSDGNPHLVTNLERTTSCI